jgi:chromosome partition protein MukB
VTRARATALVLVNWKGVFYERYLLDRHVTSLEGANGAGKTTVMIAAYVVLLPDLSRLRFTNLGETAATGGDRGIFGRLGEPGRPSYAALELELEAGERVILGVHLERKAEPVVEPKAFMITSLPAEVRLQDLFLVTNETEEAVPELKELTANAQKLGARVELFRSTREYFEELFERGVTPLRLANEDERGKLNEMLRTSMTGGISRALTSELRTFLFREETGLSDALSRMRANLDACRRSRTEVFEAQRLEREISGVFEAARTLLRLAFRGARKEAAELRERAAETRRDRDREAQAVRELEQALELAAQGEQSARERLEQAKTERARAEELRARAGLAAECRARIGAHEIEHERAAQALEAARAARDDAARAREQARRARATAQSALAQAAAGLARLEQGLEELERRARAHRKLRENLAAACAALGTEVEIDAAADEARRLRARLGELDAESARTAREIATADARRADFESAFAALVELLPAAPRERAFDAARSELLALFELEGEVRGLLALERQHEELGKRAVRQRALLDRAAALGVDLGEPDAIAALNRAWTAAERALAEIEQALRRAEAGERDARTREHELEGRRRALEVRRAKHREHRERLDRLGVRLGAHLDLDGAGAARERLSKDREAARERLASLRRERERALASAGNLEAARGAVAPELLAIADELDAELCATRFDDVPPDEAARLEAVLGPLADALLVLDPLAAAEALASLPRDVPEVLLASPDALNARLEPGKLVPAQEADVAIFEQGVVRVTRKPKNPKLGRRARSARAAELREQAAQVDLELEALRESGAELDGLLRDLERVVLEGATFADSDPHAELELVEGALTETRAQIEEQQAALPAFRAKERAARDRVTALRALMAESHWLAERADEAALSELEARVNAARGGRERLERSAGARRRLESALEALRVAPPSEVELAELRARSDRLDAERDRLFGAAAALEYVAENRSATAFDAAERALESQAAIIPSLQAEHERSQAALLQAEQAVESAEELWEARTRAYQGAEADQLARAALLAREREELARLGSEHDPPNAAIHDERLAELDERLGALDHDVRESARETGFLSERLNRRRGVLAELEHELGRALTAFEPVERRLAELLSRAANDAIELDDFADETRKSSELWAETRGKGELLLERLGNARGGKESLEAVRAALGAAASSVESYLGIWVLVRDWLTRYLPSKAAESREAFAQVASLRRQLGALEERLARQETDLRGTSEDVARGIDVQIRRAQSQVRRLNQHLASVRFGSVRGMRIRIGRLERMEQVLRALREGATQELLFQPDLPIEEALNEIFRRHGGGKNGAQRLLDYREYLDLGVEITREENGSFEPANPTRLSTGEAIGVGAALMMVVLTEWERDAQLFRGKRPIGSLRFLFLDEANRLSQDNLGVLFDLCRTLDLQLLIAAPEVARAEGNTTYRLVRQRGADGKEEVIVSGRKSIASA